MLPVAAHAELSCQSKLVTWSDSRPAVNLKHIFCGESKNGRNKGVHSNYLLSTSPLVTGISNKKQLKGGIYSAKVKFSDGKSKFSTFFPDHCTLATITRSVIYASTHKTANHRQWGILGQSAPKPDSRGYCLQFNGDTFTIRMGLMKNGSRVNTAFPQP
ncbi:MAG: EndoU domain-containing protein [Methylococcales bacterium]|nr:EndoU domain-containing protein [Methylococcales bacterium]